MTNVVKKILLGLAFAFFLIQALGYGLGLLFMIPRALSDSRYHLDPDTFLFRSVITLVMALGCQWTGRKLFRSFAQPDNKKEKAGDASIGGGKQ